MRPALYNANKIFAMQGWGAWGKFLVFGAGLLFTECG